MKAQAAPVLIREARPADLDPLLGLARELDSMNLPTARRELAEVIRRSELSFRGRIRSRSKGVYVFCAEDIRRRRLLGASMIIAKHGTPSMPHYYLQMQSDERYSRTLGRMFRHTFLRLRYAMDGPTELGGLIVTARRRRGPARIGRQLSWVRFLYIAMHRRRFERRLIAEMLPPIGPGHQNLFWDHYGRRVTGLSFREADRLSAHDKEFIRALFPDSPLYTFLLPQDVQAALGAVGRNTRGAVRLLERAGMEFLSQIDPFDGGPYYGGEVDSLVPVRNYQRLRAEAGELDPQRSRTFLVAREDAAGFRALSTEAAVEGRRLTVPGSVIEGLGIKRYDRVDVTPLG